MPMLPLARSLAAAARSWRSGVALGVLALGLSFSGVADASTLEALLRLPLERLLALRIGAQRVSQVTGPQPTHGLPARGGIHAG